MINKQLKLNEFNGKIIKVDTRKINKLLEDVKNRYFFTETNKENLSFVVEISKRLNIKNSIIKKTIKEFNGLKYRQQIIFKRKYLTIINDSKSTSFSSLIEDRIKIINIPKKTKDRCLKKKA